MAGSDRVVVLTAPAAADQQEDAAHRGHQRQQPEHRPDHGRSLVARTRTARRPAAGRPDDPGSGCLTRFGALARGAAATATGRGVAALVGAFVGALVGAFVGAFVGLGVGFGVGFAAAFAVGLGVGLGVDLAKRCGRLRRGSSRRLRRGDRRGGGRRRRWWRRGRCRDDDPRRVDIRVIAVDPAGGPRAEDVAPRSDRELARPREEHATGPVRARRSEVGPGAVDPDSDPGRRRAGRVRDRDGEREGGGRRAGARRDGPAGDGDRSAGPGERGRREPGQGRGQPARERERSDEPGAAITSSRFSAASCPPTGPIEHRSWRTGCQSPDVVGDRYFGIQGSAL